MTLKVEQGNGNIVAGSSGGGKSAVMQSKAHALQSSVSQIK